MGRLTYTGVFFKCDACGKTIPQGSQIPVSFSNGEAFLCNPCTVNNIEVATAEGINVLAIRSLDKKKSGYYIDAPMNVQRWTNEFTGE